MVFFSIRGSAGVLYEVLDNYGNVVGALSMQDFIDLFEVDQKQPA